MQCKPMERVSKVGKHTETQATLVIKVCGHVEIFLNEL